MKPRKSPKPAPGAGPIQTEYRHVIEFYGPRLGDSERLYFANRGLWVQQHGRHTDTRAVSLAESVAWAAAINRRASEVGGGWSGGCQYQEWWGAVLRVCRYGQRMLGRDLDGVVAECFQSDCGQDGVDAECTGLARRRRHPSRRSDRVVAGEAERL